ncbi:MAG TPA: hypothetical protein VN328_13585 [Thermodesulfovibrionales bacterium]|nr:hypothetical protein [Thermodesulfovibrionales bacterium]
MIPIYRQLLFLIILISTMYVGAHAEVTYDECMDELRRKKAQNDKVDKAEAAMNEACAKRDEYQNRLASAHAERVSLFNSKKLAETEYSLVSSKADRARQNCATAMANPVIPPDIKESMCRFTQDYDKRLASLAEEIRKYDEKMAKLQSEELECTKKIPEYEARCTEKRIAFAPLENTRYPESDIKSNIELCKQKLATQYQKPDEKLNQTLDQIDLGLQLLPHIIRQNKPRPSTGGGGSTGGSTSTGGACTGGSCGGSGGSSGG